VLDLIQQPNFGEQDQWQVQIQAMIQCHAQVYVHSDGLNAEQIQQALLLPCPNIEETVAQLLQQHGPDARICALPEGPQTIAFVR